MSEERLARAATSKVRQQLQGDRPGFGQEGSLSPKCAAGGQGGGECKNSTV